MAEKLTKMVNGEIIELTDEETSAWLAEKAEQHVRKQDEEATAAVKAQALATLETKATAKPVNEEKLLASLPDDALREIIVNLWARVAYLEKVQGIDRDKGDTKGK